MKQPRCKAEGLLALTATVKYPYIHGYPARCPRELIFSCIDFHAGPHCRRQRDTSQILAFQR